MRSFADLTDVELAYVAEAWRSGRPVSDAYVHALINEGLAAGASLAHSHSQLVWMAEPPPAVRAEEDSDCRICALLEAETREELRVVATDDGLVLLCPPASRAPYELLIAPASGHDPPTAERLALAFRLLREMIGRLRRVEGPVPWNAWLHEGSHWHVEVLPRLTTFAGIELGAGIYVNTLPPEEAAARLRAV